MNPVLLALTRLHIRVIGGRYVRTQTVTLPFGREQEVVVYTGGKALYSGQCTPLRVIIVHEAIFSNGVLCNYVISHEAAHKKQWWSFLGIPLVFVVLLALFYVVDSVAAIILSILAEAPEDLWFLPTGIILALICIAIPCAFSWAMELNADFKAIRVIGLPAYQNIISFSSLRKRSLIQRIIVRMTHPPKNITISVWRKLHGESW